MHYHPPKLIQLKAKANKYYVQVTKPQELQLGSDKQVRRSTGTTDRREAERRQHKIAQQIYAEFDQALNRAAENQPVKLVYNTGPIDPWVLYREQPKLPKLDPSRRISRQLPNYLEAKTWNRIKRRMEVQNQIGEFVSVVGDLELGQIVSKNGYDFAQALHNKGQGNETVKKKLSSVSGLLKWAVRAGLITANPFLQLDLSGYGKKKVSYRPFDHDQLKAIFQQEMLPLDRLCMSILATTGMRLDEVALLDWAQMKTQGEITYLDLTQAKVKTQGSERLVPLHSDLMLPARGTGRIFAYPVDRDGKAENKASKALMPYIRAAVGKDTRLVIHSFRHTIKDLLRDAGIEKEMNDFITGHSSGDTSGDYGRGPSLANRSIAIDKIDISFIFQTEESSTL